MIGYWVELSPDDNETLLVSCSAFPELASFGDDAKDAITHARNALEEAIAARLDAWEEIPPFDVFEHRRSRARAFVTLPTLTVTKLLLYQRLRELGLTRADLQKRLGAHREQVDRLFRLDHASKLDQLDAAFRALGSCLSVSLETAA